MSQRRVNFDQSESPRDKDARLKQIAGLIQKLTYREMERLSDLIDKQTGADPNDPSKDFWPTTLLAVADEVLSTDKPETLTSKLPGAAFAA